ncbi:MAG: MlaC/ttg2D family ABC transporter substrate-binding protein [Methylobacter sp.]
MRNRTRHTALWILFSTLLLGLITATALAENLLPPQQAIQNVSSQLQQKMKDKSFTHNFAQVVQFVNGVIDPYTDFTQIAQLVLGQHWRTASPEEQQRFKQEFKTLLVRTYSRAFVEYTDWSMRFRPIQMPKAATRVMVRTDILQPGRQAVEVNYRMLLRRGDWKVYDIMIGGVSLVTNYRTTFNDEIQRKGLNVVIDELAKRNAEALSGRNS